MKTILFLALPMLLCAHNLKELIVLAQENETAMAYDLEVRSQKSGQEAARNAYLPRLDLGYSASRVDAAGPFEAEESHTGYIKAQLVLFDGLKRENLLKEKKESLLSAHFDASHAKKSLSLDVATLYFSLLGLEESIRAKEGKLGQLKEDTAKMEKLFGVGLASEDEVEKIKAAQAQGSYELESLLLERQKLLSQLELLTGTRIRAIEASSLIEVEALEEKLPDRLDALEHQANSLGYKAKEVTSSYLPTITLEDGYYLYDYKNEPMIGERPNNQNKIMLSASMTLFDFFAKKEEKESLLLQEKKSRMLYSYEKRSAQLDLELSKHKIKTAKKKIEASRQALTSAQKTFEAVKKKFEAHIVDNVAYLDALSQRFQAEADYFSSKADYWIELAAYYYHAGYDIKEFVQ